MVSVSPDVDREGLLPTTGPGDDARRCCRSTRPPRSSPTPRTVAARSAEAPYSPSRTSHKPRAMGRSGWPPAPRSSRPRGDQAARRRLDPVSYTPSADTPSARNCGTPTKPKGLLEPDAGKLARPVLRGAGRSNASGLPGETAHLARLRSRSGRCRTARAITQILALLRLRLSGRSHAPSAFRPSDHRPFASGAVAPSAVGRPVVGSERPRRVAGADDLLRSSSRAARALADRRAGEAEQAPIASTFAAASSDGARIAVARRDDDAVTGAPPDLASAALSRCRALATRRVLLVQSGHATGPGPGCRNPCVSSTLGIAGELVAPHAQRRQRDSCCRIHA